MKTIDLSKLMKLAWQFYHTTGQSFSICLKKAWANIKLVRKMQVQIVKFYFQKVDGSIREAYGTLSSKYTPETSESNRKQNNTVQVYFDTECQEYRCFKKLNLLAL